MVVMTSSKVSETVSVGPRPGFQEQVFSSLMEVGGKRRHKEQVTFRPVLAPVKYADTAFVYINNTRRRFVSKTFYEPRLRPKTFSETTYARPRTTQETFVSHLDRHAADNKRWYKTSLELEPRSFKSCKEFYPNSGNSDAAGTAPSVPNGSRPPYGVNGLVDENMNNRLPQEPFQERVDPGASQVFIPKRLKDVSQPDDLALVEAQILVNSSSGNANANAGGDLDFLLLNGQTDDCSDL